MQSNKYIQNALKMLKKSPLKLTDQRMNLIKLLFKNGASHFTAEEVYKKVNKNKLKISLATIYNSLNQFKEHGLIKAIKVLISQCFLITE